MTYGNCKSWAQNGDCSTKTYASPTMDKDCPVSCDEYDGGTRCSGGGAGDKGGPVAQQTCATAAAGSGRICRYSTVLDNGATIGFDRKTDVGDVGKCCKGMKCDDFDCAPNSVSKFFELDKSIINYDKACNTHGKRHELCTHETCCKRKTIKCGDSGAKNGWSKCPSFKSVIKDRECTGDSIKCEIFRKTMQFKQNGGNYDFTLTYTAAEELAACGCSMAECCTYDADKPTPHTLDNVHYGTLQSGPIKTGLILPFVHDGNARAHDDIMKAGNNQQSTRSTKKYFALPDSSRYLGEVNKILGGILVTTTRVQPVACDVTKNESVPGILRQLGIGLGTRRVDTINGLSDACSGDDATCPYGLDPVFMPVQSGTAEESLYDASVTSRKDQFYGKGDSVGDAKSDYKDAAKLLSTSMECLASQGSAGKNPYINPLNSIPYAFHHTDSYLDDDFYEMSGISPGYFVYFDTQLTTNQAKRSLTFMKNGFFLDELTSSVKFDFMTFNGETNLFAHVNVEIEIDGSGTINMGYSVVGFQSSYYMTEKDFTLFCLEIALCFMVLTTILGELGEMADEKLDYLLDFWNIFDWLHMILIIDLLGSWWSWNAAKLEQFEPQVRYDLYSNINTQGRYLELNTARGDLPASAYTAVPGLEKNVTHAGLKSYLWDLGYAASIAETFGGFKDSQTYIYMFFVIRMMKVVDFQPRLGVVTRTISVAASDLFHFMIILGICIFIWMFAGMFLLGNAVEGTDGC